MRSHLLAAWYAPRLRPLALALTPLAWLFAVVVALRRSLYSHRWLRARRVAAPVVVVGNVTLGGTGKTPFAMALAQALAVRGRHPGIVSRGYGGLHAERNDPPIVVTRDNDPADVGDEPLLYAAAGFPVAIGRDRIGAARLLIERFPAVDALIADDGLQHYALARDCEIVVVDGARGFGNGRLLPAGPLREPVSRLRHVDAVVVTLGAQSARRIELPADVPVFEQRLVPAEALHRVDDPGVVMPAAQLRGRTVHAIAGIGDPERFFATLAGLGADVLAHPFPDHHPFAPGDIALPGAAVVVMTAKDAVKCRRFADARCWYLPVHAEIDEALVDRVEKSIRGSEAP